MIDALLGLLVESPLLLLFVVVALGVGLGQIRIGSLSLGVAAVLFVGLGFGALHPQMKLPEIVQLLGLVLFVYTIGIGSGSTFVESLRKNGLRMNGAVLGVLFAMVGLTLLLRSWFHISPALSAGAFAGAFTNTPALANVLQYLRQSGVSGSALSEPAVAYSLCYPFGVIGVILFITILQKVLRIDYAKDLKDSHDPGATGEHVLSKTFIVRNPQALHTPIAVLAEEYDWRVVFGRLQKPNQPLTLVRDEDELQIGDCISVIGTQQEVEAVGAFFGDEAHDDLADDRSYFDFRRIFVSNPSIVGKRLEDLHLRTKYSAIVTRVKRGDHDRIPTPDTTLELGDRVRVIAMKQALPRLGRLFGDSYKALSEIDAVTFGIGIALGIILGSIPIPIGITTIKLGIAGGPLLVGLFLGAQGTTGRIVWTMPFNANHTLRQFGMMLFLAGVGTRSGYEFFHILMNGGATLMIMGGILTMIGHGLLLFVCTVLLRLPMSYAVGVSAGMQTQPALLAFSIEQTKNDLPNTGYMTVYPVATIAKIIMAQLLLLP